MEKLSNNNAFTLEGKPPPPQAAAIAFQHLLAMAGGILTAPFLIATGMGLSASETSYLISSALVISGFATLLQINRVGPIGSGLLSLQGTSFAFVGPLIFSYQTIIDDQTAEEALGVIFGSAALCSLIMFLLSFFLKYLKNIITPNVSGTTVMLLGVTLVLTTLQNLIREFDSAGGFEGNGFEIIILSGVVLATTILISKSSVVWLRVGSITFGLMLGFGIALLFNSSDLSGLRTQEVFFIPEIGRYPLAIDFQVVAIVLPIFLVSTMESIGDLTATNSLSGLKTGDTAYWHRLRGGIAACATNSFVASLFSTFPNTTFSQNNGVIRLTGICSRHVGLYAAVFLIIFGCIPVVANLFQTIPPAVIYGSTVLMFGLVVVSGYKIIAESLPESRDWILVGLSCLLAYLIAFFIDSVPSLPKTFVSVLSFPVSTGALLAMFFEIVIPKPRKQNG